ncbi:Unknown protein, partial [Striga hermonthica]
RSLGEAQKYCEELPATATDRRIIVRPKRAIEYCKVRKARRYRWEVLVDWEELPTEEATWEDLDEVRDQFPNFILEDKEALEGDGNDAEVARQLKNAASRAYHARKRLAREAAKVRALECGARGASMGGQRADMRKMGTGGYARAAAHDARGTDAQGECTRGARSIPARAGMPAITARAHWRAIRAQTRAKSMPHGHMRAGRTRAGGRRRTLGARDGARVRCGRPMPHRSRRSRGGGHMRAEQGARCRERKGLGNARSARARAACDRAAEGFFAHDLEFKTLDWISKKKNMNRVMRFIPLDEMDLQDLEYLEGLERELTPWEQEYLEELYKQRDLEEKLERKLKIMEGFVDEEPILALDLPSYDEDKVAECEVNQVEYEEPSFADVFMDEEVAHIEILVVVEEGHDKTHKEGSADEEVFEVENEVLVEIFEVEERVPEVWIEIKRRREKGLCFKCEEKFMPEHRCRQAFVIEVANSDEEEAEVVEDLDPVNDIEAFDEEAEISMHAMARIRGPRTMRLPSWVKDRRVIVLVDNGSSHNFINADLSQKLNLPTTKIEPFDVRVANDERLQFTESFCKVPIKFQGVVVEADLYALPLVGPNVVLVVQWLEGLGRVTTDYCTGVMDFRSGGKRVTLKAGGEKVTKENTGAHMVENEQQQGDVRELLEEFEGVLGEPKGLPPYREFDHRIPLVNEQHAVHVHPYRYAHFQKTEIERQ